MGAVAYMMWLGAMWACVRAERTGLECEKLEVRFKTDIQRGAKNKTEFWMRMTTINHYCTWYTSGVTCGGYALTDNYTTEEEIWREQKEKLEDVVRKAKLWNVPVKLYEVFHLASERETVFIEVDKDLLRVEENGTMKQCLGKGNGVGEKRLMECEACGRRLAGKTRAKEVAKRWLEVCRSKGEKKMEAKPPKKLHFTCAAKKRTTKDRKTTEGKREEERTAEEWRREEEEDGRKEREAAGGALGVVGVMTAVGAGVMIRRWKKNKEGRKGE